MRTQRLVVSAAVVAVAVALVVALGGILRGRLGGSESLAAAPQVFETASWTPVKVPGPAEHPAELLKLAEEFRALANPSSHGVPDYAAIMARQAEELPRYRRRLDAMRVDGWSVHQKVDYLLLRSEMDDLDFDLQVWRPTKRDPGFYTRAALGNVGRQLTGDRRFRGDPMPYTKERAKAILQALGETGAYMEQARKNLTEIVPDLADIALRYPYGAYYDEANHLKAIVKNYEQWARRAAEYFPQPEASQLGPAAVKAGEELLAFAGWLEQNRSKMTGRYMVGKEALEWYLRNVLLLPYNTDQLMLTAEIERARALSFMQMEMQKNLHLPPLQRPASNSQFLNWDTETALLLRRWYRDDQQILTDREDMPGMLSEQGEYILPFGLVSFTTVTKPGVSRVLIPPADHPNVVSSYFGFYTDPGTIHGHEYWPGHTFGGLVRRNSPCPIRRGHSDQTHAEGWCFYHEELPVLLDFPYVRGPRTRELVYGVSMVIRSARTTLGIKLLSGEMTPEQAREGFKTNVPAVGPVPGIVPEIAFREVQDMLTGVIRHAVMGKLQIYKIIADRKMQLGDKFDLRQLHDQLIRLGPAPYALIRWEITGLDDEVKPLWEARKLTTKP